VVALHARAALPAYEVAKLQVVKRGGRVPAVGSGQAFDGTAPKHLSHDRCVEQQPPLLGRESVEPRRDDRSDRDRQVVSRICRALGQCRSQLFDEERVATGRLLDLIGGSLGIRQIAKQPERKFATLVTRERIEGEAGIARYAGRPSRARLEQLWPGDSDNHRASSADVGGQPLDQVEQAGFGPVDVLEHEQRWLLVGQGLGEGADRGEERGSVVDGLFGETRKQRHVRQDLLRVLELGQRLEPPLELLPGLRSRIALEDSRDGPDDLGEGGVAGALTVGKGPAGNDPAPALLREAGKLSTETRLADPWLAEQAHEARLLKRHDTLPGAEQQIELELSPDRRSI
jgi:hypothetical protein